jgi:hypothetical protein
VIPIAYTSVHRRVVSNLRSPPLTAQNKMRKSFFKNRHVVPINNMLGGDDILESLEEDRLYE